MRQNADSVNIYPGDGACLTVFILNKYKFPQLSFSTFQKRQKSSPDLWANRVKNDTLVGIMSQPYIGIIADDFTGATDIGNSFVRSGMRCTLTIGVPESDEGGLVDTLLFLPAGYISDLYGRKIALGLSLSVLSVSIAAVVSSSTIGLFFLISGLIGLGNGIGAGVFMTTGTDLAPDGAASTFLGFWRFYGDLGNAFGPMLVGVLAAALAIGPAILLTGTIGLAGAATVVLFAPETRDIARNAPRA